MSIRLTKEFLDSRSVQLSNTFLCDYMTVAPDGFTKVYIFGLYLAQKGDVSFSEMARIINMEESEVRLAFEYWQQQGLVALSGDEVVYKSVEPVSAQTRKFNKDKYKTFNDQLTAMVKNRAILTNEFNEYYTLMENCHIQPEGMLSVIAYCIRLKGDTISCPYIMAVARNLAAEGYTTFEQINERISELELLSGELKAVLQALNLKRAPDHEDKHLYARWTLKFGFKPEVIIHTAKTIKKGGITKLDSFLEKFYENKLFSIKEIDSFLLALEENRVLAKKINRIIGVYYEQVDFIVESYITPWTIMGFNEDALTLIAEYCFKMNVRTLDKMNEIVVKFFKNGALSTAAITEYIGGIIKMDNKVRVLLDELGLSRTVTSRDRDFYNTWTTGWGLSRELLSAAAALSKDKENPIVYMNKILSSWQEQGVKTVEEAKTQNTDFNKSKTETDNRVGFNKNVVTKKYTAEELNALFDNLTIE